MVTEVSAITGASTGGQLLGKVTQGAASIVALIAAHKLETIAAATVLAGAIGTGVLAFSSRKAKETAGQSKEAGEAAKALIDAAVKDGLIKAKDDSYEAGATTDVKTLRKALIGEYDAGVAAAAVKTEIAKYAPLSEDAKKTVEAIVAAAGKEIAKTDEAVKKAQKDDEDGSLAKAIKDNEANSSVAVDGLKVALAALKHDDEATFTALADAVKPFQAALDNNQEQKVVDALGKITVEQIAARAAKLTEKQTAAVKVLVENLKGEKLEQAAHDAIKQAAADIKDVYPALDSALQTVVAQDAGNDVKAEIETAVKELVWVQDSKAAFAKLFTEGEAKDAAALQSAVEAAFGSTDSLKAKITGTTAGGQAGEVRASYNAIIAKLDESEKITEARAKGEEIRAAVAEVASKLVAKDDTKKDAIEAFQKAIEDAKATIADASTAKEVRKLSKAVYGKGAAALAQAKDEAKFDLKIGDKEVKDKKASEHLQGIVKDAVAKHKTDFPGAKFDDVKTVLLDELKKIDAASKAAKAAKPATEAGYGTATIAAPVALALTLAILAIGLKYAGDKVLPPTAWAKISWIRNF